MHNGVMELLRNPDQASVEEYAPSSAGPGAAIDSYVGVIGKS